jgi:hypothetical protein
VLRKRSVNAMIISPRRLSPPPLNLTALRQIGRLLDAAPQAEAQVATAVPVESPALPEVEFVAFGEDCVLAARVSLPGERLTDLLNDEERYALMDVRVESLADGHTVEIPEVEVHRDELLLVIATGPRGHVERRQRTRQHPVVMQLGPYLVQGQFHGLPGTDPLPSLRRRKAMVPLTDASIEYVAGGVVQRTHVDVVIVNRECLDWVVEAEEESVEFPELPTAPATGRLAKDFTGELHVDDNARERFSV